MYQYPSVGEFIEHIDLMRLAHREFPLLFGGNNDFDKCNFHGLKYYIPRDLLTFREIYVDKYYGDKFTGKVLDVGSNTGLFSFYALSHGATEIVAYEPFEPVYNTMLDRMRILHESRITHYNKLLYNSNSMFPYCGLHTIGYVPDSSENITHMVASVKASSVVDPTFSLVKMDCEGSEYPIIKDLYDNHKLDSVPEYHVEIHDMAMTKGKINDIFNMFEEREFDCTGDIPLLDSPYVHMLRFQKM